MARQLDECSTSSNANSVSRLTILSSGRDGPHQLPGFQRSWSWGEGCTRSVSPTVSHGLPLGADLALKIGTSEDSRPAPEGAPGEVHSHKANSESSDFEVSRQEFCQVRAVGITRMQDGERERA